MAPGAPSLTATAVPARAALPSLTASRMAAALVVFGSHAVERILAEGAGLSSTLADLAADAVGYFFVLSGFVLVLGLGERPPVVAWWRRRLARLAPVYVVTGLASLAYLLARGQAVSMPEVLAYFTFTQAWWPSTEFALNPPAWSVSCEVFFYALFPALALIVVRLRTWWTRTMGLVVAFAAHVAVIGEVSMLRPPARLPEFALGLLAGACFCKSPRSLIGLPAAVASVAATNALVVVSDGGGTPLLEALPAAAAALLVLELAAHDRRGRRPPPRLFVRAGNWSYAFYLVHYLVLRVTTSAVAHVAGDDGWSAATSTAVASVAFASSWLAAGALYIWIERPAERRWRGAPPRAELVDP